jgi:hypothetical protein
MKARHGECQAEPWSIETTLLELVTSVQDVSRSDDEVVSVIARLVNNGRVVLRGIFRGSTFRQGDLIPAEARRQKRRQ